MIKNFLKIFFLLTFLNLSLSSFNYCILCTNHIACNNSGQFSKSCQNPKSIKLTAKNIQVVLHAHNMARNKIAGGSEPRFSAASKMPILVRKNFINQTFQILN